MLSALLLLVICQDPQVSAPAQVDIIRLKVGTTLTGSITQESGDYIEIRLPDGSIVGFSKSQTVSIARGQAAASTETNLAKVVDATEPVALSASKTRDEWYVLHDGEGASVGWLHRTLVPGEDGEERHSEEWSFNDESQITDITVLEVTSSGQPKSCFYHERTRDKNDTRSKSERVVRAVVRNDRLVVTKRSTQGNSTQSYDFHAGMRFPLEAAEELRRQPSGVQTRVTHLVFDPRREELVRQTYDVGRIRRVKLGEKEFHVRLLTSTMGKRTNTEWIDAASRTVRKEVNGAALVARPSREKDAKSKARFHYKVAESALQIEKGENFAMWLPNPMWRFNSDPVGGQISASASLYDASVTLVSVDQIDPEVVIESAADTVLRWINLVHPSFNVRHRSTVKIRDTEGVRMRGYYEVRNKGMATTHNICELTVFESRGRVYVYACKASQTVFGQIESDFKSILGSLELYRDGFAPTLQGLLLQRSKRAKH